jgi:thymidine kinase
MSKLYFRYGAMGSSKTANALMVQYNYEERDQKALLLKPSIDIRDGYNIVRSRIGLKAECDIIGREFNLCELNLLNEKGEAIYQCIIIDEAQFLTKEQVQQLTQIVDEYNIPVICYGLRTDFQGNLFEGSQWLLAWADSIEEMKTICWCGKKAIMNARIKDGKAIKVGDQIELGANDKYISLCRTHWKEGNLKDKV